MMDRGAEKQEVLTLKNVTYAYPNADAVLKEFDLSVEKGQFLGIIGPSGAGKTTIFRVLSGYLKPQKGKVLIKGKELKELSHSERARTMAMVPQGIYAVLPYTVWQIVEMGRLSRSSRISGMASDDIRRIEEALDFVKMTRYSARYFNSLSGGEKQRVLIAMSLAQDPEILLLDEPTASLDIGLKSHLMSLLKKLNREKGITVATISHDIQLASSFCDKLVMIKNGMIVSHGTVKDVLNSDTISRVYSCEAEVFEHMNKIYIETK
ncbi:MAG TPA: hypothetical protein DD381_08585 [Lentisphaeria bacterium]|nr:MAG: hypothetical protein A2X47_11100 [Lentisphaerae bacterium GWF2_38_69]HBM16379.1 hypothetical protein [Lentisphaeria bacterium]